MSNATYFDRYYARDWIGDYDEVVAFARDMVASDFIDSADGLQEYYEKPWHWEREHAWWVANARPDSRDVWEQGADEGFEVSDEVV